MCFSSLFQQAHFLAILTHFSHWFSSLSAFGTFLSILIFTLLTSCSYYLVSSYFLALFRFPLKYTIFLSLHRFFPNFPYFFTLLHSTSSFSFCINSLLITFSNIVSFSVFTPLNHHVFVLVSDPLSSSRYTTFFHRIVSCSTFCFFPFFTPCFFFLTPS